MMRFSLFVWLLPFFLATAFPAKAESQFIDKCKRDSGYKWEISSFIEDAGLVSAYFWSTPDRKYKTINTIDYECQRLQFQIVKMAEYNRLVLGKEAKLFTGNINEVSASSVTAIYHFLRFFNTEQIAKYRTHEETKDAFAKFAIGHISEGEEIAYHGLEYYLFTKYKAKKHYSDETLYFLGVAVYFNNYRSFSKHQGHKVSAFEIFEMAASRGDERAALIIAKNYLSKYVYNKLDVAYEFIKIAVANGSDEAMLIQAMMLLNGIGVEKDVEQAKVIFDQYNGSQNSTYFVTKGVFTEIENADSGSKTDPKPMYLTALNAKEGFKSLPLNASNDALFRLGMAHFNDENYIRAHELIELAALYGNRKAAHYLGLLIKTGKFSKVYGDYSEQFSHIWLLAAADAGYVPASYDVTIADLQAFDYNVQGLSQATRHIGSAKRAGYPGAQELSNKIGKAFDEQRRITKANELTFGKVLLGLFALGVMEGLENGFNWDAWGGQNNSSDDLVNHANDVMVGAYWLSL